MVTVERVRPESHVLDADQIGAVAEMVHHRLDAVPGMRRRQRGVGGRGHADDAAGVGDSAQHVVGFHPRRVPHRARSGMSQEHRLVGTPAHVKRGAIGGVRQVDGQPEPVHPRNRAPAERGQPSVGRLGEAAAESVRVGVRDPDLPEPETVEDVEPVELVFDRRGRLEPENQAHPA